MASLYVAAALVLMVSLSEPVQAQQIPINFVDVVPVLSSGGKATCISAVAIVNVSTTNLLLTTKPPADQFAATEIVQELLQNNSTIVASSTAGTHNVTGSFNISSRLCYPVGNDAASTVNILTPGFGLEKSYWDITSTNSYIEALADAGYATLAYDRIGTGSSEHPDPINIVQSSIEVEVLHALIERLRAVFKNVVCTGHSYGSIIQVAHDQLYPSDCAAVIPTGISDTFEYIPAAILSTHPTIANQANPAKFGALSNAYLIDPDATSIQLPFFRYPFFDGSVFEARLANAATYALGVAFTLSAIYAPAPAYMGPVFVVNGQYDLPYCFGDCGTPINRPDAYLNAFYPNAENSSSYIVPDTGHLINDHYNAGLAYMEIISFLKSQGL